MTFEEFADECRKEFATATEVSVIIRPYNMHVSVIYDNAEPGGEGIVLLNGQRRLNFEPDAPVPTSAPK